MAKDNLVEYPIKMKRTETQKDGGIVKGITKVGYARTQNIFAAVTTKAKRRLYNLFITELAKPKEDDVAREIAELIEDGSITVLGVEDEEGKEEE